MERIDYGAPLVGGSLAFEAGFTLPAASGAGERILAILRASGLEPKFDPQLDERISDERCPSCGRRFADLSPGHAWSLDMSTRQYRCSGPVIPGEVVARSEEPR